MRAPHYPARVTTTDDSLAADIDATCRLTGEFTLRSGQVSTEYFDKYLFEADPAAARARGPGDDPAGAARHRPARRPRAGRGAAGHLGERDPRDAGAVRAQAGQDLRHLQARGGSGVRRQAGHPDRGRDHDRWRGPGRHPRVARGRRDRRGRRLRDRPQPGRREPLVGRRPRGARRTHQSRSGRRARASPRRPRAARSLVGYGSRCALPVVATVLDATRRRPG